MIFIVRYKGTQTNKKLESTVKKYYGSMANMWSVEQSRWEICKQHKPDYLEQVEIDYNRLYPAHQKSWDAYYKKISSQSMYVNYIDLQKSDRIGCYYCLHIFNPQRLKKWFNFHIEEKSMLVLCPFCGMDCLITSHYGKFRNHITKRLLANLHFRDFGSLRPTGAQWELEKWCYSSNLLEIRENKVRFKK